MGVPYERLFFILKNGPIYNPPSSIIGRGGMRWKALRVNSFQKGLYIARKN